MALNDSLYSSDKQDWETPPALFDIFHRRYALDFDVCATAENAKLPHFFSPEQDGLIQDWSGKRCWLNPPYGNKILPWVRKAAQEADRAQIIVALLPARTDTVWWHRYVVPYAPRLIFLFGRVHFVGAKSGAPFPSAVAVYGDSAGVEWMKWRHE